MKHPPLRVAAVALLAVIGLAGCEEQLKDLHGADARDPDRVEVYTNYDRYPNIVRICIDGVAFATTTRDYEPVMRVPEWDATFCGRSG